MSPTGCLTMGVGAYFTSMPPRRNAESAALCWPFPDDLHHHISSDDERTLVDGPQFTLVHCNRDRLQDRRRWILPLDGSVCSGAESARPGECLLLQAEEELDSIDGRMLIGAAASAQSSAVRVGNDIFPAVAHRRAVSAAAIASRGRA